MAGVSKGAAGEILAARFLREKGWTILCANYRTRFGEIDIIGQDGPYIAFVEVKARGQAALYAPREAVTPSKQRRIIRAAALYLQQHPTALQPRFDVVAITTAPDAPLRALHIEHIPHAFEAGELRSAF